MRTLCCQEFGPPDQLVWVERPTPDVSSDEVLVDVSAAGIGFVDGLMVQGKYQVKPPLPYYPGGEFAGIVSAVGSEVRHLSVGTRVMGLASSGAFADQLCVRASAAIAIPPELDDATAAGFYINYATALYGLRDCGHLAAAETILILGASGGVGSAAIAVSRAMGAHVIGAASTDAKRNAALASGAHQTIDYTASDWRDALRALTKTSGLNVVYDPVGGDVAEPAFRSLSPGGRFLVVGFAAGEIPKIALNLPLLKRSSIVGVDWGGEARANPAINAELMTTLMQWIVAGKLTPAPVTPRPMEEVREALTDQLSGQVIGKVVLCN
jgi:NADPH2:quinone reductase